MDENETYIMLKCACDENLRKRNIDYIEIFM